jgi:hypothetical protein
VPGRAGGEAQRHGRDPAQVLSQTDPGPVDAVRDPRLTVDALALLQEAVRKSGRVGQQMADGDDYLLARRAFGQEIGQKGRHRIVEVEQASFGRSDRRDRNDRLRHAGEA